MAAAEGIAPRRQPPPLPPRPKPKQPVNCIVPIALPKRPAGPRPKPPPGKPAARRGERSRALSCNVAATKATSKSTGGTAAVQSGRSREQKGEAGPSLTRSNESIASSGSGNDPPRAGVSARAVDIHQLEQMAVKYAATKCRVYVGCTATSRFNCPSSVLLGVTYGMTGRELLLRWASADAVRYLDIEDPAMHLKEQQILKQCRLYVIADPLLSGDSITLSPSERKMSDASLESKSSASSGSESWTLLGPNVALAAAGSDFGLVLVALDDNADGVEYDLQQQLLDHPDAENLAMLFPHLLEQAPKNSKWERFKRGLKAQGKNLMADGADGRVSLRPQTIGVGKERSSSDPTGGGEAVVSL